MIRTSTATTAGRLAVKTDFFKLSPKKKRVKSDKETKNYHPKDE